MSKKKQIQKKNIQGKKEDTKLQQKQAVATKKDTKKAQKTKKVKKENKLSKKFKEVTSELKKVAWPTFAKVVKSTGVVLVVVIICTAVLLGIDTLLKYGLYDLIMPKG